MRRFLIFATGAWAIAGAIGVTAQQTKPSKQEPGKSSLERKSAATQEFPLTAKCGPWMVMVKSFQGPEAVEYAHKLARELREKHKIAAYTYVKVPEQTQIEQVGFVRGRVRQYPSAAVMAGDCKNEKAAAKLQKQIQKLRPDAITQDMVSDLQWRAGPLRTAFCLPNPLAKTPSEPDTKTPAILARLNSGPNSLYQCPAEYTLEAALFTGGIAYTEEDARKLAKNSLLEAAGEHAEEICNFLRQHGYDAYTYHGLTYSIVALGSFDSPNDPQIEHLRRQIAGMRVGPFNLSPSPALMKVPKKS